MLWFLIVLAGIGLMVQAWLTIRGFGPPSPPEQLDPDHRDERVLLGAPAAVLDAYRRAAEATSGMRVYGVAADGLLIDARPSAFVLDGDYGSSMRVSVRPAPDGMGPPSASSPCRRPPGSPGSPPPPASMRPSSPRSAP